MKAIELTLNGDIGKIDARGLSDALNALIRMVQSVAEPGEDTPILLSDLRVGSAKTAVLTRDEHVDTLLTGLTHLQHENTLPSGWNDTTLEAVSSINKASAREGISSASLMIDDLLIEIDAYLAENARTAVTTHLQSLGSVSGRLFRYSSRSTPEASLESDSDGRSVKLKLSNNLAPEVRSLLDRHVRVWGVLSRSAADNRVVEVRVRGIAIEDAKPPLPRPIHEGRGILGRDWTGGLDSVSWVNNLNSATDFSEILRENRG